MEEEKTSVVQQGTITERGQYKRPELVMKYTKAPEAGDSVYDSLQLLCIVAGFGSMMMGVSANDQEQN